MSLGMKGSRITRSLPSVRCLALQAGKVAAGPLCKLTADRVITMRVLGFGFWVECTTTAVV